MSQKDQNIVRTTIKKRISVSQKRQITIPIEFFKSIGIDKEVDCYIHNNSIIIRPVREDMGEFDEEILADLISQGFSGQELLTRFKQARNSIRPAVESLLKEAHLAAEGKTPFATYEDIFGSKDN
ncbi:MAG: AbrB/MazE/SpoVT family DNA-binding domain-containing protein [Actinobacteria bacterium]|nr:AbrB/MazE/SpoVT family DNA-binding domain-containing protein [Actinomycetota bacterium]